MLIEITIVRIMLANVVKFKEAPMIRLEENTLVGVLHRTVQVIQIVRILGMSVMKE